MPRPPAKLKLQTNFNAIFKNAKILKIGPIEQKLWKIRQIVGVKIFKFNKRTVWNKSVRLGKNPKINKRMGYVYSGGQLRRDSNKVNV